jgi:hypothetical protein
MVDDTVEQSASPLTTPSYVIIRASSRTDAKPVSGALLETVNYQFKMNGVKQTKPHEEWVIKIPDLVKFAKKHGPIVLDARGIAHSKTGEHLMHVTIYDDYLE